MARRRDDQVGADRVDSPEGFRMSFPGTRPIHGDRVDLIAAGTSFTAVGAITVQGVLKDGRGFVELVLPDADRSSAGTLRR
ncbi:hypothetical protein [Streptomyces sp. NPDC059278]|uniref:hypothetical protein n=1 Tax=Streptomyces sp. NPDC059278 TaxID=3346801 RepID=UPI00367CB5D2